MNRALGVKRSGGGSGASRARTSCERGGAMLKFVVVMALIGLAAYSLMQYVPVAIQAYGFKDFMQEKVNIAAATGKTTDWVVKEIRAGSEQYGVPPDAVIKAQQSGGRMEAHVQFVKPIRLPGFTYQYTFDHTARSNSFLSSE